MRIKRRSLPLLLSALAAAAGLSVATLAGPSASAAVAAPAQVTSAAQTVQAAQPSQTTLHIGQLCASSVDGHGVVCLNNYGGREANGNKLQLYAIDHRENNWEALKVGTVTNTGPFTGAAARFNAPLLGMTVVELEYTPKQFGTSYCVRQTAWTPRTSTGTLKLYQCIRTAQYLFVVNGNFLDAVWLTGKANRLVFLGAKALTNGTPVIGCPDDCYSQWEWRGKAR